MPSRRPLLLSGAGNTLNNVTRAKPAVDEKHCIPLQAWSIKTEAEIMRAWGDLRDPLVSICCATFNQADFIEDALRSFLAQETSFPFEIVIRDDASTDGTSEIVKDYVSRYPNIIRAVVETENQFSKAIRALHVWPYLARGRFIALCEGDDFWLSPHKLQRQVNLLDRYPEAVMSVAGTDICKQVGPKLQYSGTYLKNGKVLQEFDDIKNTYFHTSTYVIRAEVLKDVVQKYFLGQTVLGDTGLRFILITRGPFALLPEVVSVYRVTGGGIWTSLDEGRKLKWELAQTRRLMDLLTGEYRAFQGERLFRLLLLACYGNMKSLKFVEVLRLLPQILRYCASCKLNGYVKRKRGALDKLIR